VDRIKRALVSPALALLLLLSALPAAAPVSAHGVIDFASSPNQVFQCGRNANGVIVTFQVPVLYEANGNWAFVAYNLYGQAGFGTAEYGWAGWQSIGGNYWLAGYSSGYPYQYSYGLQQWTSGLTLFASRSNTSSFGHRWWIYTYVSWSDGHVTSDWEFAGEC